MSGASNGPEAGAHVGAAHESPRSAFSRAVRATSGMTLLSRVGGLLRDVIVGRIFGDTAIGSAFAAAFAIPNMFRRLFGEGALSAAFIPAYARARREQSEDADALASLTLAWVGAATGLLTVIIECGLLLALLLLPAHSDRELSIRLVMVMLPFMPAICCVAVLAGMLQVHGRFGPAATGPLILNTFIIVVGGWCLFSGTLAGERVAYVLGVATVLSGLTQAIWFARLLRPHVRWTRAWAGARARAREMLRRFVPVALGLGTLQVNTLLDTLIAMWPIWVGPTVLGIVYTLDERSNVILSLTQRLYQFPLGVFGIAIATAAFPLLARHARDPEHFLDTLRRGLRLSLFIAVPATVGLALVRHEAVAVMFGHGKTGWTAESLERASAVLLGFSTGIWAYSINQVYTRVFYAQEDTSTPMRVSLAMMLLNLGLNLVLIWPLREAGLAWATACTAMVQSVVLSVLATKMLARRGLNDGRGPIINGDVIRGAARIVGATAIMGVCVGLTLRALPDAGPAQGPDRVPWLWETARLGIACAVGGGSYVVFAKVLSVPELGWILHRTRAEASPDLKRS